MSRSKSGCWTCRLLTKKKCDEDTPACKRCLGLGVHCFGYGQRPSEEELRRDRRALIATVGPAARREDSKFRVWRARSRQATGQLQIGHRPTHDPRKPSPHGVASHPSQTICLTMLDRVNSGMLDFLHPQLLTDYTEQVFWLDSGFYQSPGPYQGNSWMKGFLTRSQNTHLAAALMGLTWRTWQDDLSTLTNIDATRPLTALHSLVVQNVKDDLDRAQALMSTDELLATGAALAKCASLLLTFEVWRTLEGNWITHLRGMSDILTWLASRAPAEMATAMNLRAKAGGQVSDNGSVLAKVAPTPDTSMTYLALRWFVQCYAWNDVSAAVWVGPHYTGSRSSRFYAPLLETGHLEMDKFMGCEDWVLHAMLQISRIEEGPLKSKHRHALKDWMLETEEWHQKLNTRLAHILMQRYIYPLGPERDVTFTTEMWIHAALVYLHVLTAGPRSNHPRLREYVARGLQAYESLPRHLDIHTAMPFGVLASMANEEEAKEFMRVAKSPRDQKEINPGQRKTFKILKECWRMRKHVEESSPDSGVTWRDAAMSLGLILLPI